MSRDALVAYPGFGSLWLQDAEMVERDGKAFVVGWVDSGDHYPYQDREWMNFPASCIRKWEPPLEARAALEGKE